jgi:hypothetical protein
MTVYAFPFPPVRHRGYMWAPRITSQRSVDLFTGEESISAVHPRRRIAEIHVNALDSGARSGQGYVHSLLELLDGGMHLVRISSGPANWHLDHYGANSLRDAPIEWQTADGPLAWETPSSDPITWYSGLGLQGLSVTNVGTPIGTTYSVQVSGLNPGELACRAYDVIRSYGSEGVDQGTARARTAVYADASGVAMIPLLDGPLTSGVVSIGDEETALFRMDRDFPYTVQPLGSQWSFNLRFREVLDGETPEPVEYDPW